MAIRAPFKCTSCPAELVNKNNLKRHTKDRHEKSRPYTCQFCEKQFSQSSALKTHINTHTRFKPHKCGINGCQKAFGDPSSCLRHRKEIHNPDVYCCPGCETSMKRRSDFVRHLKTRHGMTKVNPQSYIKRQPEQYSSALKPSTTVHAPIPLPKVPINLDQVPYAFDAEYHNDHTYFPSTYNYPLPTPSHVYSEHTALEPFNSELPPIDFLSSSQFPIPEHFPIAQTPPLDFPSPSHSLSLSSTQPSILFSTADRSSELRFPSPSAQSLDFHFPDSLIAQSSELSFPSPTTTQSPELFLPPSSTSQSPELSFSSPSTAQSPELPVPTPPTAQSPGHLVASTPTHSSLFPFPSYTWAETNSASIPRDIKAYTEYKTRSDLYDVLVPVNSMFSNLSSVDSHHCGPTFPGLLVAQ